MLPEPSQTAAVWPGRRAPPDHWSAANPSPYRAQHESEIREYAGYTAYCCDA